MKKNNPLPVQWIVGILIVLPVMIFWHHHQTSKHDARHMASGASSPNGFFQFLENLLGISSSGPSANAASQKNNRSNADMAAAGESGAINSGTQQNSGSAMGTNPSFLEGSNGSSQDGAGNNPDMKAQNNSEMAAEKDSEKNSDSSMDNNSESNGENNPQDNAQDNSDSSVDNLNAEDVENNSEFNAAGNMENNLTNSIQTNSENNNDENNAGTSADNSGGSSGDNSGGSSGDNSGDNSGGNPGSNGPTNLGSTYQPNLSTINPIPTDNAVSASIARQNQQIDNLATLVASRQALVVPVQQQSQAAKYQTVDAQSIPPPSTMQPPADVEAKMQAKQLTYH